MSKSLLSFLWMAVCPLCLCIFASCSDDDDNCQAPVNNEEPTESKKDTTITVGGTFVISNKCTGDRMNASAMNMFDKDTLCIEFEPEEKYKDSPFTITCEDLKPIGDGLFVLIDKTASPESLLVTATYQSDNIQYKAENSMSINVSHAYAVVPFWLQASQDLLLLSTAQVTYTDADGQKHTFEIDDEQWERPDSITLYLFRDNNGFEQLIDDKAEGEDKGWTLIEEERLGPNATYTFDVRYYHLGIDASVSVVYKRKENVAATADTYYLYHSLDRKKADITVPVGVVVDIYNSTNIDLTNHDVPRVELDDYFIKLKNSPDVFNMNISNSGIITKLK